MSILFDFDGVLLNSRENMLRSWEAVREESGVSIDFEDYFALIGKPFQVILAELGVTQDRELIEHTYFAASSQNIGVLSLFPGVPEMIGAMAELRTPIGILTSKDPARARQFVETFRLPIEALYCPTPELRGKPDTDLFIAAAEAWGVEPIDVTYVGDMSVDEEAARRFGASYIHCNWGYGAPKNPASRRAATPADLLDMLLVRYAPKLIPFLDTTSIAAPAYPY